MLVVVGIVVTVKGVVVAPDVVVVVVEPFLESLSDHY